MVERIDSSIIRPAGVITWRAGCGGSRTSGSGSGLRKRSGRETETAPQTDFHDTKLHGPAKWTYYYYLYVILDIYSRCVVGWMLATRETAALAEVLIEQTCIKQRISRGQLSLHADRGSSMTSKPVAFLLADLGVTQSHSRPHVSNDNPFSEAQSKTLKYRPDFPANFATIEAAHAHCELFSFGTTTSTGTAAWAFTPPPMCTTATPPRSIPNEPPS